MTMTINADELCFRSALELAQDIRDKKLSPVEITQTVLQRIEALDGKLNAYCTSMAEQALERAQAAETAQMQGEFWGLLHGVPYSIKDMMDTRGVRTMYGSYAFEHHIPDHDTVAVERMNAAGAIAVGKTATSEFGWKALTDCPFTGITRNPWHTDYNPGGSSGGAAAAVAAGMAPLALGSDGGGSIRIPASFCGIFGLKPSYGRVPMAQANPHNHVHEGPMTRTVADAALMLNALAGPDDRDLFSLEAAPADYAAGLDAGIQGFRVAWNKDLGFVANLDPQVAAVCEQAAQAFSELGCTVEEVPLDLSGITDIAARNWKAVMAARVFRFIPDYIDKIDPGLRACALDGVASPAADLIADKFRLYELYRRVVSLFDDYDLLLTPAVACLPLANGKLLPPDYPDHPWNWLDWAPYSSAFNLCHNPAASVPAGFSAEGLPIGLQIVGPRHQDLRVLQAARGFETIRPWADKRPVV